ncbi:MAG: Uncharacterised protein [Crocinitomicaceae bacterium]|nr:MAG: Uncharacterised protein [Crocinitomicaceae bacterium]
MCDSGLLVGLPVVLMGDAEQDDPPAPFVAPLVTTSPTIYFSVPVVPIFLNSVEEIWFVFGTPVPS